MIVRVLLHDFCTHFICRHYALGTLGRLKYYKSIYPLRQQSQIRSRSNETWDSEIRLNAVIAGNK